jgi:hypothetical protein
MAQHSETQTLPSSNAAEDQLFEENLIEEEVPDRPTSAPPVMEIHGDSLFSFRNEQQPPQDMHMMPHYQQFYDAYGDPSQLPPGMEDYQAAQVWCDRIGQIRPEQLFATFLNQPTNQPTNQRFAYTVL